MSYVMGMPRACPVDCYVRGSVGRHRSKNPTNDPRDKPVASTEKARKTTPELENDYGNSIPMSPISTCMSSQTFFLAEGVRNKYDG